MADAARSQRAAALEEKKRKLEEIKARRSRRIAGSEDVVTARALASSNLDEDIDRLLQTPPITTSFSGGDDGEIGSESVENGDDKHRVASEDDGFDNVVAEPAPAPPPVRPVVETFTVATQTQEEDFPMLDQEEEEEPTPEEKEPLADGAASALPMESEHGVVNLQQPKVLSTEEIEEELVSSDFSSFINNASKKVERVLGAPVVADLFVDYVGELDGVERQSAKSDASRFLSSRQVFECAKWTQTRDVTDLDWSPLHRELMLSSYHMPTSPGLSGLSSHSSHSAAVKSVTGYDTPSASLAPRSGELQSDGLALIWSLFMPTRPEHIFTCGSPVLAARFHPTEAPLVIGGCQSGQLVVWDVRAGRLPVQRSSSTISGSKGHIHPVCSMEVVESGTALVTASTDGRVNYWSLSNLRDPAESVMVSNSISCLAVAPETNTLVCGDESGCLFAVQSSSAASGSSQRSSRRQARKLDAGTDGAAHFGMITSLSTKAPIKEAVTGAGRPSGLAKGFVRGIDGFLLSVGVDWTVKLWAPAYNDKPLWSVVSHSYDYMCDVKWNPTHPTLFATASSSGSLALWNMAVSLDEPITGSEGIAVEPDVASIRGLNKLKWSADGKRLLMAAADRVHVLHLSDEAIHQKGDEVSRLMNQLTSRGLLEAE